MPEYSNERRGALFKNDKRETEDHPNYKGQCEIQGVEYWMDAWIKKSKAGVSYMSVSFKPKEAKKAAPPKRSARPPADDDIPF